MPCNESSISVFRISVPASRVLPCLNNNLGTHHHETLSVSLSTCFLSSRLSRHAIPDTVSTSSFHTGVVPVNKHCLFNNHIVLVFTFMMDSFWKNTLKVYKYLVILLGTCNRSISKSRIFKFVSCYNINQQKKISLGS